MKEILSEVKDFLFCMMCLTVGYSAGRYAELQRHETEMTHRMVVSVPMDKDQARDTMKLLSELLEKTGK